MQNIDFYNGKNMKNIPPQFNTQDPEYFTRVAHSHNKEEERNRKKASRMLSLIVALCIIAFTIGLIVGIKFAAGSKKNIMDETTRNAVNNFGTKVSNLIKDHSFSKVKNTLHSKTNLFPINEFPYAILVGTGLKKTTAQKLASVLSNKGHTVIISRNGKNFNVYSGPYKNQINAQSALKKIKLNTRYEHFSKAQILKR